MNSSPGYPPGGPYSYAPGTATEQGTRPAWPGRLIVLFITMALFTIACWFPALNFRRSDSDIQIWRGIHVLEMGWLGLLFKQIAWCANPVLVLSLIFFLFRRWLTAVVIALVALAIAANTFALFSRDLPADEGNVIKLRLETLGAGFYFWMASIVAVIIGSIILRRRQLANSH